MRLLAVLSIAAWLLLTSVLPAQPPEAVLGVPRTGGELPTSGLQLPLGYETFFPPEPDGAPEPGELTYQPRLIVDLEYLLWWHSPAPLPVPVVSTRPTPSADGAVLLRGREDVEYAAVSGFRLTATGWLNPEAGWQVAGFLTEEKPAVALNRSDDTGSPPLDRPVFNVRTGQLVLIPVSIASTLVGSVATTFSSRLGGIEANYVLRSDDSSVFRMEWLTGFRYARFQEGLAIRQLSKGAAGVSFTTGAFGTVTDEPTFLVDDVFEARNHFFGPQLGGQLRWEYGLLSLRILGKVAVGAVREEVNIQGRTVLLPASVASGGVVVVGSQQQSIANGGILTPANFLGEDRQTAFSMVSELGLTASTRVTSWMRLNLSYNLLYWLNVARPGEQVPTHIDLTQVPLSSQYSPGTTPVGSRPGIHSSDLWTHGLTFSVEILY